MADDGFSPEMLDAYFQALARQPDGGAGGGARTRWSPEDLEANAPAIRQALANHGVTPETASDNFRTALGKAGIDPTLTLDEVTPHLRELVLMAEGRERARPRYQKALDRAERHGYEHLRQRIERLVEGEAEQHARRAMRREGIAATAGERPTPSPARPVATPPLPMAGVTNSPVGIDYGAPQFSPISAMPPLGLRNLPGAAADGSGSVMRSMPPQPQPMPLTLSGMENPPELTREPFRPRGRVVANLLGAFGGGMGGGAVGGLPGAVAGGGIGSAGAGQLYDAAADWMLGTQERSPVFSGQTALDAAAGAIPAAGPAIGAGMRAAGRGAAEVVSAAMRRPTMASAIASGALGAGGMAATSGETQEVEIPAQFRPMDRDEFFRRNRRATKSLADLQTEAEARVTNNPAYHGLIEDGRRTQAKRMIDDARAAAQKLYEQEKRENSGEDARLEEAYGKYKAGLKADLDAYFSGRAAEEQASRDRLANTPFRQRYPNLSGALPYAGMTVAAGIPFVGRGTANAMTWLPRSASRQFDDATARAEGATSASNMRDFNIAAGEIRNSLAARPQSMFDQSTLRDAARVGARNMTPYATSGLAGGALFAEANMLPFQWDALNLPPGNAQREARSNALDVPQYLERGLMGSLGGASGYKAANILVPRRQPNWARGESAANNPPSGGGGGGGGGRGGNLPSLVERRARANPDDPRGDWIPRSDPTVPGVTSYVSREGRNEVFLDAGGNWQRRMPDGRTQFLDSRASRALDAGRPPPKYRRISQSEPNLLAPFVS